MLRPGTYYPDQCCSGYCVPVLPEDDDRTAEDGIVHDLRGDQAVRLSELLDLHGSSIPPVKDGPS